MMVGVRGAHSSEALPASVARVTARACQHFSPCPGSLTSVIHFGRALICGWYIVFAARGHTHGAALPPMPRGSSLLGFSIRIGRWDAADAARRRHGDTKLGQILAFPIFLTRFTQLADDCRWSAARRVEGLRTKVSRNLTRNLVAVLNRPGDHDIDGWIDMFRQLQNNTDDEAYR
jgi:hypothetical protein